MDTKGGTPSGIALSAMRMAPQPFLGRMGLTGGKPPPPAKKFGRPAKFPGEFWAFARKFLMEMENGFPWEWKPWNSPGNLDGLPGYYAGNPQNFSAAPSAFPGQFPGGFRGWHFPGDPPVNFTGNQISRNSISREISRGAPKIPMEMDLPGNDSREIPREIPSDIWLASREIYRVISREIMDGKPHFPGNFPGNGGEFPGNMDPPSRIWSVIPSLCLGDSLRIDRSIG